MYVETVLPITDDTVDNDEIVEKVLNVENEDILVEIVLEKRLTILEYVLFTVEIVENVLYQKVLPPEVEINVENHIELGLGYTKVLGTMIFSHVVIV